MQFTDSSKHLLDHDWARKSSEEIKPEKVSMLHVDLIALSSLQELVSLVHERVNPSQPVDSTPADNLDIEGKDETNEIIKVDLFNLKDDPVANVLWTLQPLALRCVFLTMAVSCTEFLHSQLSYLFTLSVMYSIDFIIFIQHLLCAYVFCLVLDLPGHRFFLI